MNKIRKLCLMTFVVLLTTGSINTRAQAPTGKKKQQPRPDLAATPVAGSGTSGQISKWIGFNGSSFVIGDSNITEDKFGRIGIGTTAPTSVLTVKGMVETTLGGYKFPDGTVQTTSAAGALSSVAHDATLTGQGTSVSPLAVASTLMVRDLDNPARQPVQKEASCSSTEGDCETTILAVPSGKRLVIEYVSMTGILPPGNVAGLTLHSSAGGVAVDHMFPLAPPAVDFGGGRGETIVGQQVRIYADPGTGVLVAGFRVAIGLSPASYSFTISGYLVDVP